MKFYKIHIRKIFPINKLKLYRLYGVTWVQSDGDLAEDLYNLLNIWQGIGIGQCWIKTVSKPT